MNRSALRDSLEWSGWLDLDGDHSSQISSLQATSVVYNLRAKNESGEVITQYRFLGTDPAGILYIGRTSDSIAKRMRKIAQGRLTGRTSHTVGRKLHVLDALPSFRTAFRDRILQFRFAECIDPKACENELLRTYAATFGETPPLNGEFPNRGDLRAWAAHVDVSTQVL